MKTLDGRKIGTSERVGWYDKDVDILYEGKEYLVCLYCVLILRCRL